MKNIKEEVGKKGVFDVKGDADKNFQKTGLEHITKDNYLNLLGSRLETATSTLAEVEQLKSKIEKLKAIQTSKASSLSRKEIDNLQNQIKSSLTALKNQNSTLAEVEQLKIQIDLLDTKLKNEKLNFAETKKLQHQLVELKASLKNKTAIYNAEIKELKNEIADLKKQISDLYPQQFNDVILKHTYSKLNGANDDKEEILLTYYKKIDKTDSKQKHFVFEVRPGKYILYNGKTEKQSEEVDNLPEYINGYYILKQGEKCYYFRDSDGFIGGPYSNAKPFIKHKDGSLTAYAKTGKLVTHWQEVDANYFTIGLRDKDGELIDTKTSRINPACAGNQFFSVWQTNKDSHPSYQVHLINYDSREDGIGTDLDSRFSSIEESNQFDAITHLEDEGLLKCEQFKVDPITKLPYTDTTYIDIIGRTLKDDEVEKASGTALYLYKTNGKINGRPFDIADFNPMDFINKSETDTTGDKYLKAVLEMYGEKQLGKLEFELAKKKVGTKKQLSEKLETVYKNFEQILTEKITAAIKSKNREEKEKKRLENLREELSAKIEYISSDENQNLIKSNAEQIAKAPKLINKVNQPKQIGAGTVDDEEYDEIPTVSGEIAGLESEAGLEKFKEFLDAEVETPPTETCWYLCEHDDEKFDDVVASLKNVDTISISKIQKEFNLGYVRSNKIMEELKHFGIVRQEGKKFVVDHNVIERGLNK